jgi:ribose transport system permease protein
VARIAARRLVSRRLPASRDLGRLVRTPEFLVFVLIVVLAIALLVAKPQFLSTINVQNMSRQASVLAVLSVGLMFVVLIGGIDVSVGAQMALVSIVGAKLADRMGSRTEC